MDKCIEFGRFEATRNGKKLKYKIQTITPDLIEEALDLMVTHFLPREPMSSYEGVHKRPEGLNGIKNFWRKTMEAGGALVALEDTGDDRVNIIGANMTSIEEKEKEDTDLKEAEKENFSKILKILNEVTKSADIYQKYNIDKYLSAYGLTVHSDYHGYQIGYRLLECRKPLCDALGLTATGTTFTAQNSQYLAKKAGFETLSEIEYKTYKINNELAFPNLDGDVKFMSIKYK